MPFDLSPPFLLLPVFFLLGLYVAAWLFMFSTEFFSRAPMNDFFVVHSDDIAPTFFIRFFTDLFLCFLFIRWVSFSTRG
jgi:hypothetical protein